MEYFIGLDGGGTKTKCVLCDSSLNKIYESVGDPSNFLIIGTKPVAETILELIVECSDKSNVELNKIKGILIGTTGAGRISDANSLRDSVVQAAQIKNISLNNFFVESDARIALEGALSGKPGSILIAGTGSIMFGKDESGTIHRVGGFGRIIGDEGSGLTLGRKGLNLLAKQLDEREKLNAFGEEIKRQFNIIDQSELIRKVYSENLNVQDVAPLVMRYASEGDSQCYKIIDDETNELILHILAMQKKLSSDKLKVVFIGGTIANKNFYSDMLLDKINKFLPNVSVQTADYPPEIGAVIMAKQKYEYEKD